MRVRSLMKMSNYFFLDQKKHLLHQNQLLKVHISCENGSPVDPSTVEKSSKKLKAKETKSI